MTIQIETIIPSSESSDDFTLDGKLVESFCLENAFEMYVDIIINELKTILDANYFVKISFDRFNYMINGITIRIKCNENDGLYSLEKSTVEVALNQKKIRQSHKFCDEI